MSKIKQILAIAMVVMVAVVFIPTSAFGAIEQPAGDAGTTPQAERQTSEVKEQAKEVKNSSGDVDFTETLEPKNTEVVSDEDMLSTQATDTPSLTDDAKNGFAYDGDAHALVIPGKYVEKSEKYVVANGKSTDKGLNLWTSEGNTELSVTKPGTYYVWYIHKKYNTKTGMWFVDGNEAFLGTVTVSKRSISNAKVTLDNDSFDYDGETKTVKVTGVTVTTESGKTLSLTESTKKKNGTYNNDNDYQVSGTLSASEKTSEGNPYTVTVTARNGSDYYTGSATADWSIVQAPFYVVDGSDTSKYPDEGKKYTYNGEVQKPNFQVFDKQGGKKLTEGTHYTIYWGTSENSKNASDVKYSATIKGVAGTSYSGMEKSVCWEIDKADIPENNRPKAPSDFRYNGKDQPLAIENNLPEGTNAYYKYSSTAGAKWSDETDEVPEVKEPASTVPYYVAYRIDGGTNYNDVEYNKTGLGGTSKNYQVYMNKAKLYSLTVNESVPFTYDGTEKSVTVKVLAGKSGDTFEVPENAYNVTGTTKATAPDTYTVTVSAKTLSAYYEDPDPKVSTTWTINKSYSFKDGALKIKGSDNEYAVTAKGYEFKDSDITPDFKVEADGTTLTKGTDYEVVTSESTTTAKNVGTYTIKVKGIGDYNNASNVASATWSITKTQLKDVSISYNSKTYDGTNLAPAVTAVKDSKGNTVPTDAYTTSIQNSEGTTVSEAINAGNYKIVVTAKEDSNYGESASADFEITKADIPESKRPKEPSDFRYNGRNQPLAIENNLPEGTNAYYKYSSTAGVKWSDETDEVPEVKEPASTVPYYVAYRIDGGTNYNDIEYNKTAGFMSKNYEVKMNKAKLYSVTVNESVPFTYDGTEKSVTVKVLAGKAGETFEVPEEAYNVTGDKNATDPGTYTVTVSVKTLSPYYAYYEDPNPKVSTTWTINKSYSFKDGALKIKGSDDEYAVTAKGYEFKDSDITPDFKVEADGTTLTKGTDYEVVTSESTTTAKNVGTYTIKVKGIGDYSDASNVASATWSITKTQIKEISLSYDSKMYDGSDLTPSVSDVKDSNGETVPTNAYTTSIQKSDGTPVEKAVDAGNYKIVVTAKESGNYDSSAEASFEITKSDYLKNNASTLITGKSGLTYNGQEQELVDVSSELSDPKFSGIEIKYKTAWLESGTTEIPKGKDAKTITGYPVWFEISGGNNYERVDYPLAFPNFYVKIDQGTPAVTVTSNTGLTYTGQSQELVKEATAKFGEVAADSSEVVIKLNCRKSGETDWMLTEWVAPEDYNQIVGTDAGKYEIGYWIEGSGNWKEVKSDGETLAFAEAEIAGKELKADWITLENMPWTGKEQSVDITVTDPDLGELTEDTDYEVSGARTGTNAGTYTVKIKGIGNYKTDTPIEKTWKIVDLKAELSDTEFTYDTKEHDVKVSVTRVSGEPLDPDAYEILNSESTFKAINAGEYHVKVMGTGDYAAAGTIDLTWTIKPAELAEGDVKLDRTYFVWWPDTEYTVKAEYVHKFDNGRSETLTPYDESLKTGDYILDKESAFTNKDDQGRCNAGEYKVKIQGTGNYTGTAEAEWMVQGVPMDMISAALQETTFTYDGTEKSPKVNVGLIGLMDEGEDYAIEGDTKATEPGTYTIVVRGKGKYYGEIKLNWTIKEKDMSDCVVVMLYPSYTHIIDTSLIKETPEVYVYDINEMNKTVKEAIKTAAESDNAVKLLAANEILKQYCKTEKNRTLVAGDDYELSGDLSANAKGTYYITITGKGNYTGAVTKNWVIAGFEDNVKNYEYRVVDKSAGKAITYDGKAHEIKVQKRFSLTDTNLQEWADKLNISTGNVESTLEKMGIKINIWEDVDLSKVTITDKDGKDISEIKQTDAGKYSLVITGITPKTESKQLSVASLGSGQMYGTTTITWELLPKEVQLEWTGTENVIYDGNVHRPVLKCKTGYEFVQSDIDSGNVKITEAKAVSLVPPKNAGTYAMYARVEFRDGFNAGNYSIAQSEIEVLGSYIGEKVYDGFIKATERLDSFTEGKIKQTLDELIGKAKRNRYFATEFVINKRAIGVDWKNTEFTYDGKPHAPTATAKKASDSPAGEGLIDGDYCRLEVSGEQTNAGKYTAEVTGLSWVTGIVGNYKLDDSDKTCPFEIKGKDIGSSNVVAFQKLSEDLVYNGKIQKPTITVFDHELTVLDSLKEGVDFQIDEGNKSGTESARDAGEYTIIIKGIGNYSGTAKAKWEISPRSLKDDDVTVELTEENLEYNGREQTPELVVNYKDEPVEEAAAEVAGGNLKENKDYTVTGTRSATEVYDILGISDYTIYVHGKGNFKGIVQKDWNIVPLNLSREDLDMVITFEEAVYGVDEEGQSIVHNPVIKSALLDGQVFPIDQLKAEKVNKTDAGTYDVSISGSGKLNKYLSRNVEGSTTAKWTIKSKVAVDGDEEYVDIEMNNPVYNGGVQSGKPEITDGEKLLVEGTDYDITGEYEAAVVGEYTMHITFKGNYSGEKDKTWNITKRSATITAVNAAKLEGHADPDLYLYYDGVVKKDIATIGAYAEREKGEAIGSYAIHVVVPKSNVLDNYNISTVDGIFTIAEAVFTVSFDNQGHGQKPDPQRIAEGALATNPVLSEEGYVFEGWFTEKECKKAWDFENDKVMNDITLYAKWSVDETPKVTGKDFFATGTAKNGTNTIKWKKVEGAEGYDIYFAKCGKTLKKVKTTKALKYTKKGLNSKYCYKYRVKAYKKIGKEKTYIATAPTIHVAGTKSGYSNATAIKTDASKVKITIGESTKINAKITKKSSKKKVIWEGHKSSMLSYRSSDAKIVSVDANGEVTGHKVGAASVYVYSANGAFAKVEVVVYPESK